MAHQYIELQSNDEIIRFWAKKAIQVLENSELSNNGRIRIIQDIQKKIKERQKQIEVDSPNKAKLKRSKGLGNSDQITRLRQSFKQVAVETTSQPITKKVHLRPRGSV